MEQAELWNRKGGKPMWVPVHVTGHNAPRKKGTNGHPKMDDRNRSICPDQMFQIDNNARREPGESGPRIGVAGKCADSTHVTGHLGTAMRASSSQQTRDGKTTGPVCISASGSLFKSRQQVSPSSVSPQSGQHLSLCVEVSP